MDISGINGLSGAGAARVQWTAPTPNKPADPLAEHPIPGSVTNQIADGLQELMHATLPEHLRPPVAPAKDEQAARAAPTTPAASAAASPAVTAAAASAASAASAAKPAPATRAADAAPERAASTPATAPRSFGRPSIDLLA